MSLQTIEIEAFSGPTSVLIGGGNQPTIVYINQGPAGSAGNAVWGGITGTLSSQTDLQDALDLKANLASPTFTGIVTAPRIEGKCAGLELFSKAGQAINAGQVVYVTGASGTNVIIGLAQANTELTSSKTIGVSESTLALNATGYVITEGLMTVSISSATALVGDPIWLSGTTAGGMLFGAANKPVYPYHVVYLGVVTRKTGNTVVEIYVKVQNGFELDELSDVLITDPLANQALVRNSDKWINRALVSNDISDSSTGGNGAADAGKLVEFNSTGGVAVSTINNLAITAAANSTLTIEEDKSITLFDSITTEFGGYINTDVGGYIVTGVNGNITTGAGGYIQTGIGGHITTAAGGSFATGTGNLTGPNTSGTIALTSDIPPAATVDATVIDGSTNAVSGNAVFDSLALKAPLADPTFTGEVVINTLVGVNKNSLTISNTSDGDGQQSYGLKINKSGVDSFGLDVYVGPNVENGVGVYSSVSGDESIGLVSVANGVSSKGVAINSSGDSTKGLTVTADGEYSTGIVVESSGTENVGVEINSTDGDYHAKFRDAGTSKSFVARLNGAFGWFRGAFTGRIQAADTLTEDRTYTLPDAAGTVALINPSTGTQTFSGAQSFTGNVGIGTTSPSVKLHAIATTEQLRVGYDASNYLSTTVSSAGLVTLNAVGTSTGFVFSDKVTASSQGESKDLAQNDVITSQLHRSNLLFEGLRYVPYSPSLNSAGGTIVAGNFGIINVDAGATTFRRMYLSQYLFISATTGSSARFDHNFRMAVTGNFYINSLSLVEQRIYVGSHGSFTLPFAGLGAYPANTRGYGFKVRQNPSTANQLQVAVFARDGTSAVAGTYIESGWVNFGVNSPSSALTQAFVIEKIGTTVNLYGTDTRDNATSGGPRTRTPSTVIATVSGTGVPNDYAYVATNWSSVEAAIIGDGTTANVTSNQNLLIRSGFMEIF